jgi:hypothetical protein
VVQASHIHFFSSAYVDTVMPGCTLNLRNTSIDGGALRIRNPFSYWVIHMPTTGYKQPILQFACEKSNKGSATNTILYTTDGTNYTSDGITSSITITTTWTQYSIDFSAVSAANDNPKFAIKFANSIADTSGGNDRYDNVTLDAFTK